jgi:hypothetical protein
MRKKIRLIAVLLGGFLLAGTATPSVAASCEDRVRKAQENLQRERDRHGEHSKQAEAARRNLEKEQKNCPGSEHPTPEQRGIEDQHRNPR